jgi:hypothetical protein
MIGFSSPRGRAPTRRSILAPIVASAALVLSISVTVTAVSIEIARADVLGVAKDAGVEYAAAVLMCFVFLVMAVLTAVSARAFSLPRGLRSD